VSNAGVAALTDCTFSGNQAYGPVALPTFATAPP
jgi:hypothetical protein